MTETGSGVVYDGHALRDVELATAEAGAADAGTAASEILIRAPMLLRCYRDGDTGRVVGPDGTDTWFATGDAGSVAPDGTLSVSGRIDDVINTGGEKVWPEAVERVLNTHRQVAEVAVWKRADPEWGERVVAWVVPKGGSPGLEELQELAAGSIAPWAAPKELVIVDSLPRSPVGKVRRRQLDRN